VSMNNIWILPLACCLWPLPENDACH
jgi:hypothetical protein